MNRTAAFVLVTIVAAAAVIGGLYWWEQTHLPPPAVVQAPAPPVVDAAPPAAPAIKFPVDTAALTRDEALPPDVTLDHSDAALRPALAAALPDHALPTFFHADRIIRNVVATVDALPREQVALQVLPIDPVGGRMAVTSGDAPAIAPDNAARYSVYVGALQKVNAKLAASAYLRFYPFFQQAYRELGYPNGYFNDRLVQVIDLLLATPDPEGPITLTQPKVLYVYADPTLEALPAGQKMLLRMGHDNAAIVKAKLREFRGQIVRAAPDREK